MESWVRAIINSAVAGLIALAQATYERIAWVYGIVMAVGFGLRDGWNNIVGRVGYYRAKILNFAGQVYVTLWYLMWVRIPSVAQDVINNIVAWTAGVINGVRDEILWLILGVQQWVSGWIDGFTSLINSVIQWATQEVGELWDLLYRVAELVFLLLTDPRRMAKWVLGALLAEALQFVDDNMETLLDMVRRKSIHYAGLAAARIESVLVRLL